jgi:hypothetical protein
LLPVKSACARPDPIQPGSDGRRSRGELATVDPGRIIS